MEDTLDHPHLIRNTARIKEFIFGGKARFTLKSIKTGKHYTYRVAKSKDRAMHFVSVLTNGDNTGDYEYAGFVREGSTVVVQGKRGHAHLGTARAAIEWALRHCDLFHDMDPQLEFWHAGRCARCAHPLTDPVSIERGFGPECIKHVGAVA